MAAGRLGREDLVDDVGGRERQQRLAERAAAQRQRAGRRDVDPEPLSRWNLVEADGGEPDAPDDDGGLARLLGEQLEDRVGGPDQEEWK